MPSVTELTQGFKPVETKYATGFYPFYDAFFKTRKYPRFYQSVFEMSQYKRYFWCIIDGCLVFIHKRYIHRPVLYLILPPMHFDGNIEKEISVMNIFRKENISTKLSEEDVLVYEIRKNDLIEDKNNYEYLYFANEYKTGLNGKKWKTIRSYINQFNRLTNEGVFKTTYINNPSIANFKECEKIYTEWLLRKNKKSVHSAHKLMNSKWHGKDMVLTLIYKNNNLIVWGISEKISNGKIIQTSRFRSYNNCVNDPTLLIHNQECIYWSERFQMETYCNLGIGYFPELIKHKERLHPVYRMQIYKLKTDGNITHESWKSACVQNNGFGF